MTKNQTVTKNFRIVITVLLIISSLVAAILKIIYGSYRDETYIVFLAYKLASGGLPLKDVWDLYQTSALFPALFVKLFLLFSKGSVEGLAVYLRSMATVLQAVQAFYVYKVLKKYYRTDTSFFVAVFIFNFTPRATQNLDYGFNALYGFIFCCTILLDVAKTKIMSKKLCFEVFLAGVFYAFAVFCYPTMIVSVPFVAVLLLFYFGKVTDSRTKVCLSFLSGVIVSFLIFILSVMSYMSLDSIISVSKTIALSTGDHSGLFGSLVKWDQYPHLFKDIAIRLVVVLVAYLILYQWLRKKVFICYTFILAVSLSILLLNVTNIRLSGPFGRMERYFVIGIMPIFFIKILNDRDVFWIYYLTSLFVFLGALAGTNLEILSNAMYLELGIMAVIIYGMEAIPSFDTGFQRVYAGLAILVFVFSVIASKGHFMLLNSTPPANIQQADGMIQSGPLKGIHVPKDYVSYYMDRAHIVSKSSGEDFTYCNVGGEAMNNFYFKGIVVAPEYVATLIPNEKWIVYYRDYGHCLPDFIYIDKKWCTIKDFYDSKFGDYVRNLYVIEADNDLFYVLRRQGEERKLGYGR